MIRFMLFFLVSLSYSQEHILIGDSQTFLLKKHSKIITQNSKLSQAGIGVLELTQKVRHYPINTNVKTVTICVGVNDNYVDKGITQLIDRIKNTFPKAKLYVIKGSWGWGKIKKLNTDKFNNYYKKFAELGAQVIQTPIGEGDPHRDKKNYKTIMQELENKINN